MLILSKEEIFMNFNDNFKNLYTRDELMKLGIYDLRKLGQDLGVVSPTSLKKEKLVDSILAVIYGETPVRKIGKGRGRPPKDNKKPCKLYLDLIEKINEPDASTEFVYVDRYDYGSSEMVASPRAEYINNDDMTKVSTLKRGVVCDENGSFFVRKLRYIPSENDYILPKEIAFDYSLKDCDLIEFLLCDDGKTVSQIIKINGNLASRTGNVKLRGASKLIKIGSDITIRTNESNIVYAKTPKERAEMSNLIAKKLVSEGYKVVSVNFDSLEMSTSDDGITRLYCVGSRDEYETMAVIENAIERARMIASLEEKCVLLVDNLGWLLSVVETFPKYLYGNFIPKLAKLSSDRYLNISVVCIMSDVSKEDATYLAGIFDNFNLNEPL